MALNVKSLLALKLNGELQTQATSIDWSYISSDEVIFLLPGFSKKVALDPKGRYLRVTWDQLLPSLAPPVGTPSFSQATGFLNKPLDHIKKFLSSENVNLSLLVIGRDDKIEGVNGTMTEPKLNQQIGQNANYQLGWIGEAVEPTSDALQLTVFA